jgi:hypothetical protein
MADLPWIPIMALAVASSDDLTIYLGIDFTKLETGKGEDKSDQEARLSHLLL